MNKLSIVLFTTVAFVSTGILAAPSPTLNKGSAFSTFKSILSKEQSCLSNGGELFDNYYTCEEPTKNALVRLTANTRSSRDNLKNDELWREINNRYIVASKNCEVQQIFTTMPVESLMSNSCKNSLLKELAFTAIKVSFK